VFRDFRLFVVSVLIENQGRSLYMPMILDTGASYLTVRSDVFEQLRIVPNRKVPLVTASERAEAPVGQVNKVIVGVGCFAMNISVTLISLMRLYQPKGFWELPFCGIFLFLWIMIRPNFS